MTHKLNTMYDYKKIPDFKFNTEELEAVAELKSHFPDDKEKSALLPLLHLIQEKHNGWLSNEAMDYAAELLHITPIEVYETTTFYSMFNLKPVGKNVIEFCRTGPCCQKGAENLIAYAEKKLGIKEGETTADGMFTIKTMECLGACGYAPMVQIGDLYFEDLTYEKMDQLISDLRDGSISTLYDPRVENKVYVRKP